MSERTVFPTRTVREFLGKPHQHYIGGKWTSGASAKTIEVFNPATEEQIATVPAGGEAEIDAAVAAAREAFDTGPWPNMAPTERAGILFRFADLIAAHSDALSEIETLENGMSNFLSKFTVEQFISSFFRYYAGWTTKLTGETMPSRPLLGAPDDEWLVMTVKDPIGVVGMITPWNAPLAILSHKLAPALAAGCTLVLKPAELTPLATQRMVELSAEAGIPPGVINLVQGTGSEAGAQLARHDDVDKISFTGSTEVGRSIIRAAAGNLKRVQLELGGKSPVVVFDDADIVETATAAATACFIFSGQNCMAGTRLFLHERIEEPFLDALKQATEAFKIGNGFEDGVMLGPLISATQKSRVLRYIKQGLAEGAELLTGGDALPGPGHWVKPAIFTKTTPDMSIVREEIFGPVLVVQTFSDADVPQLANTINDSDYGLSGSVWTQNIQHGLRFARMIDSGQVSINAHAAIAPETPFGGNKQSGWGRECGREGIEAYLKTKAISIRH